MEKAIQLFKALSDKSRLRILNSLREGPMYVELLSQRLELAPSTISFHLKKLEECGLVSSTKEQYYVVFALNTSILESRITDLISFSDEDTDNQNKREEQYRKSIIETYFKGDKLTSIPVQKEKRRVILEKIIKKFSIDKNYKEKEVNIILADINDDFVTLRRELVKSELLIKEKSYYKVNITGEFNNNDDESKIHVIEDMLFDKEEVICEKTEGFLLDIRGLARNLIKDEAIFITSRGRIITYQTTIIKGLEFSKCIFSYNFSEKDGRAVDKGIIQSCFDKSIFQDNKKILYNIINDEVICYGHGLKVRQQSSPFGANMSMNITFSLSLDEFEVIKRKINVNIFEEEKK